MRSGDPVLRVLFLAVSNVNTFTVFIINHTSLFASINSGKQSAMAFLEYIRVGLCKNGEGTATRKVQGEPCPNKFTVGP